MCAKCQGFTAAKILPNPKLENQRKIFIRGLSKQYGFAPQEFLVIRGNDWGFSVEWPAHPPLVGVGVCQRFSGVEVVCSILNARSNSA